MGLKDSIENVGKDIKDSVNEAGHRTAAEGEQTKRDVAGDDMTAGEKAGSMFNQAKESVKADTSAGKRETRDSI